MEYKDINDYELLYLISDIQDDEVVYLLSKYEPFIQKKCMKWKAILNKLDMDMEDLEQEVKISFLEAIKSFKEEKNTIFYTYLNAVIDNKINNLIRTMNTNKNLILSNRVSLSSFCADRELEDFVFDDSVDIEKKIEIEEIKEKVYEFLYSLPIVRASVLELYFNNYSVSSISRLLDKKEDSVRRTLRVCRKKLKDYLQKLELSVL